MTGRRVIVDHGGARAPREDRSMNLERCTHADFLEIVSDVEDFCGTDRALGCPSPDVRGRVRRIRCIAAFDSPAVHCDAGKQK